MRTAAHRTIVPSLAVAMFLSLTTASALAADEAGSVSRLENEAHAVTEGVERTLARGDAIHLRDTVETEAQSKAELSFLDGTALVLGENASIVIDEFVYAPGSEGTMLATVQGAFRFVTGQIGNVPGKDVTVRTPFATISIRGTDFWGGPIDGNYGVFLLDGEVTITTEGGSVTLSDPGTGTTLTGAAEAPGAIVEWPQEKVDRAIATVTFQ
jgi:hypothetical protein